MRAIFNQRIHGLRPGFQALLALVLLVGLFGSVAPQSASAAVPIPVFYITAVDKDNTVSIKTYNFPANRTFVVRMGKFGTLGIGGVEVATTLSGTGGTFTATYNIPASLKGLARIAIRLDGTSGGYYSYNWFWNNTANVPVPGPTATPGPGYTGIPTFAITNVVKDTSVAIKTNNFPANKTFTVRMGKYGTLGIGGIVVGTTNSGAGGIFSISYNIPAELKGLDRIAIRLDATSGGYYSYNWFWNNPGSVPPTPPPYSGIPTFAITTVVKDDKVTITTNNFPANRTFVVRMGKYGTLAIGGTEVATTNSGAGGVFTATYTIPAELKGQSRIAIRMDATTGGFYSYNWFWNN
jgi:hypothetical protein